MIPLSPCPFSVFLALLLRCARGLFELTQAAAEFDELRLDAGIQFDACCAGRAHGSGRCRRSGCCGRGGRRATLRFGVSVLRAEQGRQVGGDLLIARVPIWRVANQLIEVANELRHLGAGFTTELRRGWKLRQLTQRVSCCDEMTMRFVGVRWLLSGSSRLSRRGRLLAGSRRLRRVWIGLG